MLRLGPCHSLNRHVSSSLREEQIVQGVRSLLICLNPLRTATPAPRRKQLQAITRQPNTNPGKDRMKASHWASEVKAECMLLRLERD